MFRPCLVLKFKARKHTADLLCSFSARQELELGESGCVWVRNAIKIAAVLSASNHEKECCCFLSHCPVCGRFMLSCCENMSQAYIKGILLGGDAGCLDAECTRAQ